VDENRKIFAEKVKLVIFTESENFFGNRVEMHHCLRGWTSLA